MSATGYTLLQPDEPAASEILRPGGASPFLLICDHAGCRIPRRLDSLGLPQVEIERHIGWDIGVASTSRALADLLDATLILQTYSRLVIDCNRPLQQPDSIAKSSERTLIPGNQQLDAGEIKARRDEIFAPYHAAIRTVIDARLRRGQPTLLVAMHSFTPVYLDKSRPWHAGVLYNRDARLALALRDALRAEPGLVIGDNEPYDVSDETDYSIPEHGERRGLAHVEFEIRQDLIRDPDGQLQWAQRLARLLPPLAQPPLI